MTSRGPLPRKAEGLHGQALDGEFVVVNAATQQAHALTGLAAELWAGIDADTWPAASDSDLDAAVAELTALGLVQTAGVSRRSFVRQAGTVAVAGTVISIGLPMATAAASGPVGTATTLSSSSATPRQGASFTVTVTVAPAPGGGTVQLKKNGVNSGVPQDATSGSIQYTFTGGTSGATDTFSASFSGSTAAMSSSSTTPLSVTYSAAATTTALLSLPGTSTYGGATTLNLGVTSNNGTANGTAALHQDGSATPVTGQSSVPVTGGSASFTFTSPTAGSHTYVAKFTSANTATVPSADSNILTVAVAKAATTTSASGLTTAPGGGQNIAQTVLVTVTSPTGAPAPTGSVKFTSLSTGSDKVTVSAPSDTVTLTAGPSNASTASFTVTNPGSGRIGRIKFAYLGDPNEAASSWTTADYTVATNVLTATPVTGTQSSP